MPETQQNNKATKEELAAEKVEKYLTSATRLVIVGTVSMIALLIFSFSLRVNEYPLPTLTVLALTEKAATSIPPVLSSPISLPASTSLTPTFPPTPLMTLSSINCERDADFNDDGVRDTRDLTSLQIAILSLEQNSDFDVNRDRKVDEFDVEMVADCYVSTPTP
jgi:hypothetical protein